MSDLFIHFCGWNGNVACDKAVSLCTVSDKKFYVTFFSQRRYLVSKTFQQVIVDRHVHCLFSSLQVGFVFMVSIFSRCTELSHLSIPSNKPHQNVFRELLKKIPIFYRFFKFIFFFSLFCIITSNSAKVSFKSCFFITP